jgi:hypothetical protein
MVSLELTVTTEDDNIIITGGPYETYITSSRPTFALSEIESGHFPLILGHIDDVNVSINKVDGIYNIYSQDGDIAIICINNIQFMNQLKGVLISLQKKLHSHG